MVDDRRPSRGGTRQSVALACSECGARNYKTTKKPGATVELKKFCKACNQHTVHHEAN